MKAVEFCYWLQGYFEIHSAGPLTKCGLSVEQTEMIKRHLALVFKHEIDPSYPNGPELQKIHDKPVPTANVEPHHEVLYRC